MITKLATCLSIDHKCAVSFGFILAVHINVSCCEMQIQPSLFAIACQNIVRAPLQQPGL